VTAAGGPRVGVVTRLRDCIGAALRRHRLTQERTLREVAEAAGVSLTYLSEVERGRKEASSEVLEAICAALDIVLSDLLFEVAEALARVETGARAQAIGFLPASRAAVPLPGPDPAPVARVLDFQAYAGRRTA
jgi:transcriptional regulator with XRE-family HTH domain